MATTGDLLWRRAEGPVPRRPAGARDLPGRAGGPTRRDASPAPPSGPPGSPAAGGRPTAAGPPPSPAAGAAPRGGHRTGPWPPTPTPTSPGPSTAGTSIPRTPKASERRRGRQPASGREGPP